MEFIGELWDEAAGFVLGVLASRLKSIFTNNEDEFQKLKDTFEIIKIKLMDAEQNHMMEDPWRDLSLRRLKYAFNEIDDLIDEYESVRLQEMVSRKRKLFDIEPIIRPLKMFHSNLGSKIYKINQKWGEVRPGEEGFVRYMARAQPHTCQPLRFDDQADALGRADDQHEIVELLISDDLGPGVPVVPICGSVGIGKTKLARIVFEDPRIESVFDFKTWVTLCSSCDARDALKKIYEEMTGEQSNAQDLYLLQDNLRNYLGRRAGNKFLLVIDNLWADDEHFWKALQHPLLAGGEGSKVLMTTRNKSACWVTGALHRPILTGLSDEACWRLIQSIALTENTEDHDEKTNIGMKIAVRCLGSPMAAYTIGKLLNERSITYWSHMLTDMRFLRDDKNGALASLMVSYNHLDYVGKKLFGYCCLFPNGYKFGSNQLIRCWYGEQLIPLENNQPEKIGRKYFDKLVDNSFIEEVRSTGQERLYRMPVLMHDLSKIVSEHEFWELKRNNIIPISCADQVRYASLVHQRGTEPVKIERAKYYHNVRSLKLCKEYWHEELPVNNNEDWHEEIPVKPITEHLFHELLRLRVLDLSNSNLKDIPDSICALIHLRYLAISKTRIRTISERVCDLINLQTLELEGCLDLRQLPKGMRMLINLRHLDLQLPWKTVNDSTEVVIPTGISEIENLQTLSRFNVRSTHGGCDSNIVELKHLNLIGELCLLNLERVPLSNPEDAKNASLRRKNIENLMLRWCISANSVREQEQHSERVLEYLEPNHTLKKFWLINYPGNGFPYWMQSQIFISLHTIRISNCRNFQFLMHLKELPNLNDLQIDKIRSNTMRISEGFPSLKRLVLSKMCYLHTLSLRAEFPELKRVYISRCPCFIMLDSDPYLRAVVKVRVPGFSLR